MAALLVGGAGLFLLRGPRVAELAVLVGYGRGYVPWFDLEWKARQTAAAAKKPLLVYRVDPAHPAAGELLRLLEDPAVQAEVPRVVWLRSEQPAAPGEPPRAPALVVHGSNTEDVLTTRQDAHTLTAPDLARLLREAAAANAALGEK